MPKSIYNEVQKKLNFTFLMCNTSRKRQTRKAISNFFSLVMQIKSFITRKKPLKNHYFIIVVYLCMHSMHESLNQKLNCVTYIIYRNISPKVAYQIQIIRSKSPITSMCLEIITIMSILSVRLKCNSSFLT